MICTVLKESLKMRIMGIIYCEKRVLSTMALKCYETALEIRRRRRKDFEVAQTLHTIRPLFALG